MGNVLFTFVGGISNNSGLVNKTWSNNNNLNTGHVSMVYSDLSLRDLLSDGERIVKGVKVTQVYYFRITEKIHWHASSASCFHNIQQIVLDFDANFMAILTVAFTRPSRYFPAAQMERAMPPGRRRGKRLRSRHSISWKRLIFNGQSFFFCLIKLNN